MSNVFVPLSPFPLNWRHPLKRLTFDRFISILAITVFVSCAIGTFAQKAPDAPASVVKAFPPGISAEMEKANNDFQLAKAQQVAANALVDTANANIRALLFKASKEMKLSEFEEANCPYGKNQNGAWVFTCPPEKKSEPPKDDKGVKPQ